MVLLATICSTADVIMGIDFCALPKEILFSLTRFRGLSFTRFFNYLLTLRDIDVKIENNLSQIYRGYYIIEVYFITS